MCEGAFRRRYLSVISVSIAKLNSLSMAVAAQWSLDSTVSVTLSISRGISHVDTRNNIQPLALLTSDEFSSTIPMCHEIYRKIETDVLPTNPPATIGFLKKFCWPFSQLQRYSTWKERIWHKIPWFSSSPGDNCRAL